MGDVTSKIVDDGRNGDEHKINASITMSNVSQSGFESLKTVALGLAAEKDYNLNGYNCTNYALEVFNSVRNINNYIIIIDIPGSINYGTTPNGLYKYLNQAKNTDPNISIGKKQLKLVMDLVN